MQDNILIIVINVIVILGVLGSVFKFRYDKQLQDSKIKIALYWLAIALILLANGLSIFHNLR